ncbi:MAG: EAL domain-containing protein [Ruminococcus sp.]|nr:EAL domain-containing protein [Ruminococcus sp.]
MEEQTLVGGLRAVELYYRSVRDISTGQTAFLQSQTRLNTPDMGVMMPESYRELCDYTNQCVALFGLELVQALETHNKFISRDVDFRWLSVYMPVAFLKDEKAEKGILGYTERYKIQTNRLCFELPEKLLDETDGLAAENIKKLRNRGFHFMLTGFGASSCPMMRLSDFAVDYVLMSAEVTTYLGRDERSDNAVRSMITFAKEMGAEPVADGVVNSRQAETLFEFDCNFCTGSLAGKYTQERYIRRRGDDDDDGEQADT